MAGAQRTGGISTHVIDLELGRPAAGLGVSLHLVGREPPQLLARAVTDADGRVAELAAPGSLRPAEYLLDFETGAYFAARGIESPFPSVAIRLRVRDTGAHHHLPLLLAAHGYTAYRGS